MTTKQREIEGGKREEGPHYLNCLPTVTAMAEDSEWESRRL